MVAGDSIHSYQRKDAIMAVDPVCGIHVDEKAATPPEEYTTQYSGQVFYFCSDDCKQKFDEAPEEYARRSA
jgi:Cu+-exporting ATPase